ncbi:DUF305 domain-containing protein [Aquipuribacter sp. MA13-6]|uniref:DUF305 domain-containing protein n=1 Tax=unclassified Aquipuribacter TaxID=2635084 RepID=UPI003EED83C6
MTSRSTSPLLARPFLTALAVVGGALLVVVGLLLGSALAGPASAAVPTEDSVDAGFARDMQVHHGQAVEMSVMVRDRSDDPTLRQIALDVLLTQQNQQGQMAGWLQLWGLPQASAEPIMGWMSGPFSDGMEGMTGMAEDESADGAVDGAPGNPMIAMGLATDAQMAALRDADGVEAERIYLQLMIPHHVGGVEMAEVAQDEATQPQVRRLAESMVNAQTFEITVLQDLLDDRGGPVGL